PAGRAERARDLLRRRAEPVEPCGQPRRPGADRERRREHRGDQHPHDRDPVPGCPDERVVDRAGQELRLDARVGADDQDLMPHVPTSGRTIMTRWRASATIRRTTWSYVTRRTST